MLILALLAIWVVPDQKDQLRDIAAGLRSPNRTWLTIATEESEALYRIATAGERYSFSFLGRFGEAKSFRADATLQRCSAKAHRRQLSVLPGRTPDPGLVLRCLRRPLSIEM